MNKKGLLYVVAVISPSAALASDWQRTGLSVSNAVWYVDAESVRDIQDTYNTIVRKAWVKVDFALDKTVTYRERVSLMYFKCNEEQAKTISSTFYNAGGVVSETYTPNYPTYSPIVPDTVLSSAMKFVCAR